MELNSSNMKASYLANPILEDEQSKSIISSSKISSSEISESNERYIEHTDTKGILIILIV